MSELTGAYVRKHVEESVGGLMTIDLPGSADV